MICIFFLERVREINIFSQQGCIKLIKSYIYSVPKFSISFNWCSFELVFIKEWFPHGFLKRFNQLMLSIDDDNNNNDNNVS